jgi:DNA-binding GntR family transcriptional regulator
MKASERAYHRLVSEILDGKLEPGAPLGEIEQAARLGISRTPLREALLKLSSDGLIENVSGRGARVSPLSREDISQLYETRRALEELAARLAARRGNPQIFAELAADFRDAEENLTEAPEAIDRYYQLNDRFDTAIDESLDNPYLVAVLRNIRQHAARIRRIARRDIKRLRRSASETRVICEAILEGEQDVAAHATHLHLHHSLMHVLRILPQTLTHEPTNP